MSERVFVVARIFQGNKLAGFRLMDSLTGEHRNISCEQAIVALKNNAKIANLELVNGELRGISGRLDRYAAVNTIGALLNKPSLTIFGTNEYNGSKEYVCGDYNGQKTLLTADELFAYSQTYVISNYKVFKNRTGTVCILPIDGQTDNENLTQQSDVSNTKSHRKYTLPDIPEGAEFTRGYRAGNIANVFKSKRILGLDWIKPKMIYKKRGLCRYNYSSRTNREEVFNPDSGYNELLLQSSLGSTYTLRITGVKIYNEPQLIVQTDEPNVYLLDDIIYIGKNWYSIRDIKNKPLPLSTDIYGTSLIGLGLIGLVIFYVDKGESRSKLLTNCIPYSRLTTVESLTKALVEAGIPAGILSDQDIKYIMNTARKCPYNSRFNINEFDIPTAYKTYEIGKEKGKEIHDPGLLEISELQCDNIANVYSYTLKSDEGLRVVLHNEISLAVKPGDLAYFNIYSKAIRGSGDSVTLKTLENDYRIDYMSIRLRYIAYLVLDKLNILDDRPPESLINSRDRASILFNYLWRYKIIQDKLYMFIGNYRVIYNIQDLLNQYNSDIGESNSISASAAHTSAKMGILGINSKIESNGYISYWTDDTVINQTSALKGIIISDKCKDNRLIVHSSGIIDIIDKRTLPFRGSLVTITFKSNSLRKIYDIGASIRNKICIGINLHNATASEIDSLMAFLVRKFTHKQVMVDGCSKSIRQEDFDYTMPFIVRNASKLLSQSDIEVFKNYTNETIFNVDKTSDENKLEIIKICMANIPKRRSASRNISIELVKCMIESLFSGEKQDRVMNSFIKWTQQ